MAMQMAELHYTSRPSYDAAAIAARAEELLQSGIAPIVPDSDNGTLLFAHKNLSVEYKDTALPPQTAILGTDKSTGPSQHADKIQQSWACEDAAERMGRSKSARLVTEMMAQGIVAGDAYLKSCSMDPIQRLGSLNVRFFNISNSDSKDMIMDTRGLDEVGLHDLQCHFRDLDPNSVSQVLLNTGLYIFENGPVIESGQTVAGAEPESQWKCQFEESLLEPKRELLDINPGAPHAAGGRETE